MLNYIYFTLLNHDAHTFQLLYYIIDLHRSVFIFLIVEILEKLEFLRFIAHVINITNFNFIKNKLNLRSVFTKEYRSLVSFNFRGI